MLGVGKGEKDRKTIFGEKGEVNFEQDYFKPSWQIRGHCHKYNPVHGMFFCPKLPVLHPI